MYWVWNGINYDNDNWFENPKAWMHAIQRKNNLFCVTYAFSVCSSRCSFPPAKISLSLFLPFLFLFSYLSFLCIPGVFYRSIDLYNRLLLKRSRGVNEREREMATDLTRGQVLHPLVLFFSPRFQFLMSCVLMCVCMTYDLLHLHGDTIRGEIHLFLFFWGGGCMMIWPLWHHHHHQHHKFDTQAGDEEHFFFFLKC